MHAHAIFRLKTRLVCSYSVHVCSANTIGILTRASWLFLCEINETPTPAGDPAVQEPDAQPPGGVPLDPLHEQDPARRHLRHQRQGGLPGFCGCSCIQFIFCCWLSLPSSSCCLDLKHRSDICCAGPGPADTDPFRGHSHPRRYIDILLLRESVGTANLFKGGVLFGQR